MGKFLSEHSLVFIFVISLTICVLRIEITQVLYKYNYVFGIIGVVFLKIYIFKSFKEGMSNKLEYNSYNLRRWAVYAWVTSWHVRVMFISARLF
jgi:hypothetical protein